ncbi:MAG: hypothetical protein ACU84H_14855 [Gammaproteobacteria bacterium]
MAMLKYMGIQNKSLLSSKKIMFPVLWGLLSGCVAPFGGYIPFGHSRKEFEHYVEEVFRFENNLTSQVMMLHYAGEIDGQDPILRAERTMHQVCKPLNDFVSREMEGLSAGYFLSRRVMNTAMDCDHEAHELKKLLDEK